MKDVETGVSDDDDDDSGSRARDASGGRRKDPLRSSTPLLSALDDARLEDRVRHYSGRLAVFLDYDGTLTRIVRHPGRAFLSEETRNVIRRLSSLCPVVILSGRDAPHARSLVDVDGLVYAGSHGFDILMSDGKNLETPRWEPYIPLLDRAESELRESLRGIAGATVERKRFAICVHYRRVERNRVHDVWRKVDIVALSFSRKLRRSTGKMVLELLPDVAWDKGRALLLLQKLLEQGRSGRVLPIFIGDDVVDEEAFRVVRTRGFGILVGARRGHETYARYSLRDPTEVRLFLEKLVRTLEANTTRRARDQQLPRELGERERERGGRGGRGDDEVLG